MKLAVFDLDGTLLPMDCGNDWVHYVASHVEVDLSEASRRQAQFARDYAEGNFNVAAFMDFHMSLLAQLPRARHETLMANYLQEKVLPNVSPRVVKLLQDLRTHGYTVIIATGTQGFVSMRVAQLFGVEHVLATMPLVKADGEFSGERANGYCYGEHKVARVKEFLDQLGLTADKLEEFVAFTDSINDLPLLEFAHSHHGRAIATNPDPRLKEKAEQMGWTVVNFF